MDCLKFGDRDAYILCLFKQMVILLWCAAEMSQLQAYHMP